MEPLPSVGSSDPNPLNEPLVSPAESTQAGESQRPWSTQPVAENKAATIPADLHDNFGDGFQTLDPRSITVERISGWIFAGVAGVLGALALIIFIALNWPPDWVAAAASSAYVLGLVLIVWANLVLPEKSYRHAAWRLNEAGLEIRQGIWWRHEITIPLARVQHTDVQQGPLARRYGLARLLIHTAGTQDASVPLAGLAQETAHWLRDALVAQCEAEHAD